MEFVVGPGAARMWISWSGEVAFQDVIPLLLGPVMACLVTLGGHTCLHGSVIALDGKAVAFLGASGAGKSTLALACIRQGAQLVSDDLVFLDEFPGGFTARCGTPALRLWPSAGEALPARLDSLRPICSHPMAATYKQFLDFDRNALPRESAVPLVAITLLGSRLDSTEIARIERLRPASALAALMAHRTAHFLVSREGHTRDFARLSRLTSSLPVLRLSSPDRLEGLDRLGERVLAEVFPRARHSAPVE